MLLQQSIVGNSRSAADQWREVQAVRNAAARHERMIGAGMRGLMNSSGLVMVGNEGIIPQDVYQDFDNVTVERFRSDDGDTFLNDLLPLSRSVNIGKLVQKFRRASDAGNTQTSMSGQVGIKMDQVEFNFDGALIPIHDGGYFRNWREFNAMSSEGFDGLIDDQRETVASLRKRIANNFLDGHLDADGNFIVLDAISWEGMRNDSRVAQVNIGASGINFDFTDTTKTFEQIEAAFKEVRNVLFITNNCAKEATYYVSRLIMSNLERFSSEFASSENKVLQRLASLQGVKELKSTNLLVGNEMMAFPLDGESVRPIVGMGLNTVAMPRPIYNSNFEFAVWGAVGFSVRTDFSNQKCALFAQDLG